MKTGGDKYKRKNGTRASKLANTMLLRQHRCRLSAGHVFFRRYRDIFLKKIESRKLHQNIHIQSVYICIQQVHPHLHRGSRWQRGNLLWDRLEGSETEICLGMKAGGEKYSRNKGRLPKNGPTQCFYANAFFQNILTTK